MNLTHELFNLENQLIEIKQMNEFVEEIEE